MKLVFLGSGAFGVPTLAQLLKEHEISLVVTQPDRPAGRGGKLQPTPIGELASQHDVELIKPERINETTVIDQVRSCNADAFVVIAYGQKLGVSLLDGVFAINLHASLLPRWRGAAPIHHAVMAGDVVTGNSVITLASEMDAGDVLATTRREIMPEQTTGELHDLLATDGPQAIFETLHAIKTGGVERQAQDPNGVTLAPKLSRADAEIDWNCTGSEIRAHINGLSPWPGCSVTLGEVKLKLLRAGPAHGSGPTGTLLDPTSGLVAGSTGAFRLLEVQPAGKRPMTFEQFARGQRLESGVRLEPTKHA